MRKMLAVTILSIAMSVLAFSQTIDRPTRRSEFERVLIALSQNFVKASVGAVTVEEGGVRMTPFGPMPSLEVKEQWETVGIMETKVHIDGDHAIVTGQVVFGGQAPEDKTRNNSSTMMIHFLRQKEQWKLLRGCLGECSER